jgi:O-antigen/teichoic acid export membrane protein
VPDFNRNRSVKRNIAANYVGRAASLAANFVFVPIYVSIVGVEAYGVIAFYTLLLTFTALADVGLSATFSRQAAQMADSKSLGQLLIAAEKVLLFSVGACCLLIFLGAGWISQNWLKSASVLGDEIVVPSLRIMAVTFLPQIMLTLYSSGLLGLQRQVEANIIQLALVVVRGGLVILPLLWSHSLILFFIWQMCVTIIFAGVARRMLIQSMGLNSLVGVRFEWEILRPHWRYAAGMATITVISIINTQFDKVLISRLFTLAEYAYYSIASALAQLPIAAATPIAVAFFPRLVASMVANKQAVKDDSLSQFSRLIAFVAALGGGGLAFFSPEVLSMWLQDPLIPKIVSQITTTLAVGSIIICLNMPSYYACLARGQTKVIAVVGAATLIISVPGSFFALQSLGLWGGALMWVLVNAVHFVVLGVIVLRSENSERLGGHLREMPVPVAIALVPMFAGRLLADWFSASSLLACVFAVIAAVISIVAFFSAAGLISRLRRRKT